MPEAAEMNIETASSAMAADILGNSATEPEADDPLDAAVDSAAADTDAAKPLDGAAKDAPAKADAATAKGAGKDATPAADAPIPMPKSWAKEQQDVWDEMTPRARTQYLHREKQMLDGLEGYKGDAEYGRTLKGVLAKHEDILRSQGLQAPQAVEYLFNAHRQLSDSNKANAQAYFERLAKTYGLALPQAQAPALDAEGKPLPVAQTPPEVKAALERLDRIEGALTAEQTRAFETARVQAAADVEAFASHADHPHFDECAEDIAKFIKGGEKLEAAYEKAVWANPVTRQKEIARIQQATDKANAEKVKEAAKAAKRATSSNVKGRDTTRAPTEGRATVANMDEVLRETYAEINSRT